MMIENDSVTGFHMEIDIENCKFSIQQPNPKGKLFKRDYKGFTRTEAKDMFLKEFKWRWHEN